MTDERHNLPKGTGKLPEFLERPPFDPKTAARLLATFDSGLQFADLAPWAERLRGAIAEVERLIAEVTMNETVRVLLSRERDDLRAEVARLTAERDAMRPVVEAAELHTGSFAGRCACNVCMAVDAYRASKAAS